MTSHEPRMRDQLDAAIERIQKTLREYPWHIGRSGRIRATLLEETDEQNEKTVCPIAMLSMHTSEQQIETVLANPAHRQWAERVEETVRTEVAEHVEAIAEENDSGPPTDRNELRRYAAALLIDDEPKSNAAAELMGLEPETAGLLADAADDASRNGPSRERLQSGGVRTSTRDQAHERPGRNYERRTSNPVTQRGNATNDGRTARRRNGEHPMRIEQLMKQAEQIHEQLHQNLATTEVEATAGGGMVTVAMNGLKQVRAITIDPEIVSKDDVEFLQDLVVAAINDAHRKVDEETSEKMGALLTNPPLPRMVQ